MSIVVLVENPMHAVWTSFSRLPTHPKAVQRASRYLAFSSRTQLNRPLRICHPPVQLRASRGNARSTLDRTHHRSRSLRELPAAFRFFMPGCSSTKRPNASTNSSPLVVLRRGADLALNEMADGLALLRPLAELAESVARRSCEKKNLLTLRRGAAHALNEKAESHDLLSPSAE